MTLSDADLEVIDQRVQAALSHLIEQLPNAIASGITTHAARPPSERGSPSLQFGVVEDSFPDQGFAQITLDGQINPIPVSMLGPLTVGERVAVLFYPPSGTLAIGQVSPVGIPGVSISNLPPAGTLTGGEDVPVDQSGTTVRTTTQDIADLAAGSSGFPVGPDDDGTATHEIQVAPSGTDGVLLLSTTADDGHSKTVFSTVADASGSGSAQFILESQKLNAPTASVAINGGINSSGVTAASFAVLDTTGVGTKLIQILDGSGDGFSELVTRTAGGALGVVRSSGSNTDDSVGAALSAADTTASKTASINLLSQTTGDPVIQISTQGGSTVFSNVVMENLPTSDPHNLDQLFMTGFVSGVSPGTVMVSAG